MAGPPVRAADPDSARLTSLPATTPPQAAALSARRVDPVRRRPRPEPSMSRYTPALGFALVAIWIAVIFLLTSTAT